MVNILEDLHHKTGRRVWNRGKRIKTKVQLQRDKQRYMERVGTQMITEKKTQLALREWIREGEVFQEKVKSRKESPRVKNKWFNEKGEIWMMSANIRGELME